MKKVHIVISVILAIVLVGSLLLLGTGLLRFGWVDIPYDDIVSIQITSTLMDHFQFDVADPYHIKTLTDSMDNLGLMLHTPKNHSTNGSLCFINLKSSQGIYYSVSIQDEMHFTANNRRYRADLKAILSLIASLEEQARNSEKEDLSQLFYRALHEPDSNMAFALAEAFDNAPDAFIAQLAQEEHEIRDNAQNLLIQYHVDTASTVSFATYLLNRLADVDSNTVNGEVDFIGRILFTLPVDFNRADTAFIYAVLDGLPHADGAMPDNLGYYLSCLYEIDPPKLIRIIADKDPESQKEIVSLLVYSTTYSERIPKFIADTENLSVDNTLTEAEQAVVTMIQEELASYNEEALTPMEITVLPTEDIPSDELIFDTFPIYEFQDGELIFFLNPAVTLHAESILLRTTTAQLSVYSDFIPEGASITVSLYKGNTVEAPVYTTALTAENKTVLYSGLPMEQIYIVSMEANGVEDTISIKVTDQSVEE